jgi:uncharacterized phage protein (TIGR01671 family)
MRVIKFQAWYQGKMYEVIGLFFNEQGVVTCGIRSSADSVHYMGSDQVKLRQFIGRLDKHGQEVYEGDIVKGRVAHSDHIEEVEYGEVRYGETGELSPFCVTTGYDGETWVNDLIGGFEIIGNIYQHSELVRRPS